MGGVSSELYGFYEGQGGKSGSQGEAVVAAMKKWGENEAGTAGGTELGFPVCKRGYKPFGEDGARMYGCAKHSNLRLEAMRSKPPEGATADTDGLYHRPGWERFDQWVRGEKPQTSSASEASESRDATAETKARDANATTRAAADAPPAKRSRLAVATTA